MINTFKGIEKKPRTIYSELLKSVLLGMGTFREVLGVLSSLDYEYLSNA